MTGRSWVVFDTILAWLIVLVSCGVLVLHPLPYRWHNVLLGVLAAAELLTWLWMIAQRQREPDVVHRDFLTVAMGLFVAIVLVSSRAMWG